jgi:hypothetical protein
MVSSKFHQMFRERGLMSQYPKFQTNNDALLPEGHCC